MLFICYCHPYPSISIYKIFQTCDTGLIDERLISTNLDTEIQVASSMAKIPMHIAASAGE